MLFASRVYEKFSLYKLQLVKGKTMKELLPAQTSVPHCFGCGRDNPAGMKLRFTREDSKTVSTRFTPPKDWTGWANMLHGGFHAVLLDEVMAWAAWVCADEPNFVTADMSIKYLRPAYVEQEIIGYGEVIEEKGRDILVRGWLMDTDGNRVSEGSATIKRINPEKMQKMVSKE